MSDLTETDSLTCRELVELVTEYLEKTLPDAQRARVTEHLADCDGCNDYIEQMRQTIAALSELKETDVTSDAQVKLIEVFQSWRKEPE
jgi:predicted anti-sigma-YlaC factor YlaD